MTARTRSRSTSMLGGLTYWSKDKAGTSTWITYTPFSQTTQDVHEKLKRPDGSLPPGFFESNVVTRAPAQINRGVISSFGNWVFVGREIYEDYTPNHDGYYPIPGSAARLASNQELAMRLLRDTNPFNPEYSVPVAIKELVEVAGMFKLFASSFAGFVGGTYLNYRFGWKSFYSDVQQLAGITKVIESRFKEFNYLLEHGHTRKRMRLASWKLKNSTSNVTMHSAYSTTIKGTVTRNYSMETWGTVTWGLSGNNVIPVDELERFNKAISVVLDLEEMDPLTLWELVPFSWLVDYFTNIGDLLGSQALRYEIQPYDVCIMRHFRNDVQAVVTSKPSTVSVSGSGNYLREIKTRDWVLPSFSPTLTFDLLTADRWKVLLALLGKFLSK